MPNAQMPFLLAMDLNGTGTLVDVTSFVRGTDGVQKTGTRQDQFRDPVAATITFVLENYDGRFTPGNVLGNGFGTYVNPPTERMTVCWSSSSLSGAPLLRQGSILTLTPSDDNWSLLSVTCDDMLGAVSRNTLGNLAYSAALGTAYLFWPLNEAASVGQFAEVTGKGVSLAAGTTSLSGIVSGLPGVAAAAGDTQISVIGGSAVTAFQNISATLPTNSLGWLGAWVTVNSATAGITSPGISLTLNVGGNLYSLSIAATLSGGLPVVGVTGTATASVAFGVPTYVAVNYTTTAITVYFNGTQVATGGATFTPGTLASASLLVGTGGLVSFSATDQIQVQHITWSPSLIHEEAAGISTEANRLLAIDQTTPQITLATLPTDLSTAPIGVAATTGQSALDAINAVIKTEQGYIDCVTTGTYTAPSQAVRIRSRNRPATVTYAFNAQTEISAPAGGTPIPFIRDSTNLVWLDVITGLNSTTQTVQQTALQARAGSNNTSDTVSVYLPSDLYEWGSDRLWHGSNIALRPASITIDNLVLGTDRSADLNAMVPGDRIQITNIPSTILGFTTWDGWLLDKDEDHRSGANACDKFTLYLQPAQPATGIFDTDLFANGGNNFVSTAMTAAQTTMAVKSTDGVTLLETSTMNYYLLIDSEVVKVTACTAPVAGVQTATIVRAQNSTTATTHALNATFEVVDTTADLPNNPIFAY